MDIKEILSIEDNRNDLESIKAIHLFKDDKPADNNKTFFRAYNWSCYLIEKILYKAEKFDGKTMNAFRSSDDSDFAMWGIPQTSLDKIVSEKYKVLAEKEDHIIVTLTDEDFEKIPGETADKRHSLYKEWKKALQKRGKKNKNKSGVNTDSNEGTERMTILQRFLALDPATMSPKEIYEKVDRIKKDYLSYVVQ